MLFSPVKLLTFFCAAVSGAAIETLEARTSTNPTFVVVPGAWHSPVHYAALIAYLTAAGYEVVSQRFPSVDSSTPKSISCSTDQLFIQNNEILNVLNQGKDVVVISHSYGGSPGAAAAHGLSKKQRKAAGLKNGVIGMIFIAALLVDEGVSLKQAVGGQFNDWVVVNETSGQLGYTDPKDVFYNDVNDTVAKLAISQLRPESENALSTGCGVPAWKDTGFQGCLAYVHTLLDQGIPPFAQNAMISATGATWKIANFNTGHCPFLSQPVALGAQVVSWTKTFMTSC